MNARISSPRRFVLLSGLLLVVLAGSLALRLLNQPGPPAVAEPKGPPDPPVWTGGVPAAEVPAPGSIDISSLRHPEWSAFQRERKPVRFQTDLDLLAPLGNGKENAALWFADFARPSGARFDELAAATERAEAARAAMESLDEPTRRALEVDPRVLLPDDPLLLEAEPWVDQATMRFYPDVWPVEGFETRITNLLMVLNLGRTWAARGDATDDLEAALADYRRAVRLGRLMRQEDAMIINDLVGLSCIGFGLDGIYRRAIEAGDTELALLASMGLGEIGMQRLQSSAIFTNINVSEHLRRRWFRVRWDCSDADFDSIVGIARSGADRRFRVEALVALGFAKHEGSGKQRSEAEQVLEESAAGDDLLIATTAQWSLANPPQFDDVAVP